MDELTECANRNSVNMKAKSKLWVAMSSDLWAKHKRVYKAIVRVMSDEWKSVSKQLNGAVDQLAKIARNKVSTIRRLMKSAKELDKLLIPVDNRDRVRFRLVQLQLLSLCSDTIAVLPLVAGAAYEIVWSKNVREMMQFGKSTGLFPLSSFAHAHVYMCHMHPYSALHW